MSRIGRTSIIYDSALHHQPLGYVLFSFFIDGIRIFLLSGSVVKDIIFTRASKASVRLDQDFSAENGQAVMGKEKMFIVSGRVGLELIKGSSNICSTTPSSRRVLIACAVPKDCKI
ncbi:hypothetical protein OPV22_004460 [Ensete ventricosum]|uniref:Uncharacterized protein n=1 Tax=Ensete ventricosum TaxID=4639 RepID=A0AAV8S3V7_ENSVE|nr:hypothetical protein OPV22_004460 [Ensete ventricosum]